MTNSPIILDSLGELSELSSAEKLRVTLGQLDNVDLAGLTDGDTLRYDSTTQKFQRAPSAAITPAQQFWQQ